VYKFRSTFLSSSSSVPHLVGLNTHEKLKANKKQMWLSSNRYFPFKITI